MNYYNYIYLDPRKPGQYFYDGINFSLLYEPIYVGKGKGYRKNDHLNFIKKGKSTTNRFFSFKLFSIIKSGQEPIVFQINKNIFEKDAYEIEEILIEKIGRYAKGGILCNAQDGGFKPPSSLKGKKLEEIVGIEKAKLIKENSRIRSLLMPVIMRKQISEKLLGHDVSEITKEKIRIGRAKQVVGPCLESTKKKISNKLTGHEVSKETRRKISQKNKGNIPPNKGIPHTEETKNKIKNHPVIIGKLHHKTYPIEVKNLETGETFIWENGILQFCLNYDFKPRGVRLSMKFNKPYKMFQFTKI